MRVASLAFLFALFAGAAFAQGAVQQAGPVTPGHPVGWWGNGVAGDPGPASGSGPGISEIHLQVRGAGTPPYANGGSGPLGTNDCNYDAPITNPTGFHYLCLSPNANGGGLIDYGAVGSAPQLPLNIIVNGTASTFPLSAATSIAQTFDAVKYCGITMGATGQDQAVTLGFCAVKLNALYTGFCLLLPAGEIDWGSLLQITVPNTCIKGYVSQLFSESSNGAFPPDLLPATRLKWIGANGGTTEMIWVTPPSSVTATATSMTSSPSSTTVTFSGVTGTITYGNTKPFTFVIGNGVQQSSHVVSFVSGTPGGNGTYTISQTTAPVTGAYGAATFGPANYISGIDIENLVLDSGHTTGSPNTGVAVEMEITSCRGCILNNIFTYEPNIVGITFNGAALTSGNGAGTNDGYFHNLGCLNYVTGGNTQRNANCISMDQPNVGMATYVPPVPYGQNDDVYENVFDHLYGTLSNGDGANIYGTDHNHLYNVRYFNNGVGYAMEFHGSGFLKSNARDEFITGLDGALHLVSDAATITGCTWSNGGTVASNCTWTGDLLVGSFLADATTSGNLPAGEYVLSFTGNSNGCAASGTCTINFGIAATGASTGTDTVAGSVTRGGTDVAIANWSTDSQTTVTQDSQTLNVLSSAFSDVGSFGNAGQFNSATGYFAGLSLGDSQTQQEIGWYVPKAQLYGNSSKPATFGLAHYDNTSGSNAVAPTFRCLKSHGTYATTTSVVTMGALTSGDHICDTQVFGDDGYTPGGVWDALFSAQVSGAVSLANVPSKWILQVTPPATSANYATFTGYIISNVLTATNVTGTIANSGVVRDSTLNLPALTTAAAVSYPQVSGTPGGAGVYNLSVQSFYSPLNLGGTATANSSGTTTLTLSSVSGYMNPTGLSLSGNACVSGATIVAQLSGTAGGAGTYQTNISTTCSGASIVASEAMVSAPPMMNASVWDGLGDQQLTCALEVGVPTGGLPGSCGAGNFQALTVNNVPVLTESIQTFTMNDQLSIAQGTTNYAPLSGNWSASEAARNIPQSLLDRNGTFGAVGGGGFYCSSATAPGTGQTFTLTLYTNGNAGNPVCVISGTNTTGSDLSDTSVSFAGGQGSIQIVSSSGAATTAWIKTAITFQSP